MTLINRWTTKWTVDLQIVTRDEIHNLLLSIIDSEKYGRGLVGWLWIFCTKTGRTNLNHVSSLLSPPSHDKPTQTKYQESPCHLDCLARLIKCILQQTKSLKHLAEPSGLEFCVYFLLGSLRYSGLRGWSLDSKSLRPQISPQPPSSLLLLRDACPVPSARTKIGIF